MRTYYIFKVKEEFQSLYQENQIILYSLFKQLTKKIEKEKLDKEIFLLLHGSIPYSKRKNIHHINNLYKDETSQMIVKHAYIQVECNQDISFFFNVLQQFDSHYFVCDFDNQDYFFLEKLKMLV